MKSVAREIALIALAMALTWWVFLRESTEETSLARVALERPQPVALTPVVQSAPPVEAPAALAEERESPAQDAPPPSASESDLEPDAMRAEPAPPPPELGAPDGAGEEASPVIEEPPEEEPAEHAPVHETATPDGTHAAAALMVDTDLLATAQSELSGDARQGFATVFLASPEEQIDIARFFGEELVLVPKRALNRDAEDSVYFRLAHDGPARIETIAGLAPLERFRQHRDLFAYEYARLPAPLRELRRSVLARSEIFIFAALIPAREWALVIGRRREALAESGRDLASVRRFVLEYVQDLDQRYDVRVIEIVFADGERFRPSP